MKTDKPFIKAFSFGAIFFALLIALLVTAHAPNITSRIGYFIPACLLSSLIVGIIARQSKKTWSWVKVGGVVFVALLIILALQMKSQNSQQGVPDYRRQSAPQSEP